MKARSKNTPQSSNRGENKDSDLHELFLDELADMYHAEHQLTKALPKMAKAAESDELRTAFEMHLNETETQITRLEEVFDSVMAKVNSKTCEGMKGIISEGEEMLKEMKNTSALDATLIAAAQKVEHYEIASYGTLAAWARQMGHQDAAELLEETLSEEKAADEKLTQIATSIANQKAESTS
jgi:ferritin-like metal-binding protein YciE